MKVERKRGERRFYTTLVLLIIILLSFALAHHHHNHQPQNLRQKIFGTAKDTDSERERKREREKKRVGRKDAQGSEGARVNVG